VVKLATEEDVDVIGISSLATDHLLVPKLMNALRDADLGHVGVVVGGIVPDDEEKMLLAAGVDQVFHPGSHLGDIVEFVRRRADEAQQHPARL
jgi:methylmalonyl-CoA mutase, C-terminal domain